MDVLGGGPQSDNGYANHRQDVAANGGASPADKLRENAITSVVIKIQFSTAWPFLPNRNLAVTDRCRKCAVQCPAFKNSFKEIWVTNTQ